MKRPDVEWFSSGFPEPAADLCRYILALEADHRAMREALERIERGADTSVDGRHRILVDALDWVKALASSTLAALRIKEVPPKAAERKTNDTE